MNKSFASLTFVISLFALSGCFNLSGENHDKAEREAKQYAKQVSEAGSDIHFVSCMDHDTDGDGYLACSFILNGKPVTLDCAGKSLIQDNHGCKQYVAKLRMNSNSNVKIHGKH